MCVCICLSMYIYVCVSVGCRADVAKRIILCVSNLVEGEVRCQDQFLTLQGKGCCRCIVAVLSFPEGKKG